MKNPTYEFLLEEVQRGSIKVGYSSAIVFEVLTKPKLEYRDERRERGRVIKSLCGECAFPYISDIRDGFRFPNEGVWLPMDALTALSHKSLVKCLMDEARKVLKENGANRAIRRKLRTRKQVFEFIRRNGSDWGCKREDFGGIPVPDKVIEDRLFANFIKGKVSAKEFDRALQSWIVDPEEFCEVYYVYSGKENAITEFFNDSVAKLDALSLKIENLKREVFSLRERKLDLTRELQGLGLNKREARELVSPIRIPELKLSIADEVDLSNLESSVGGKRVQHFRSYLKDLIRNPGAAKGSDAMDLMHAIYAYDCDVFRCDKRALTYLQKVDDLDGKLISNIQNIECFIKERLGRRA